MLLLKLLELKDLPFFSLAIIFFQTFEVNIINDFIFMFDCSLILGDLEVAFNTLLTSTKGGVTCALVNNNPFSGRPTALSLADAELITTFDLAALTEIGRTKSILGVSQSQLKLLF